VTRVVYTSQPDILGSNLLFTATQRDHGVVLRCAAIETLSESECILQVYQNSSESELNSNDKVNCKYIQCILCKIIIAVIEKNFNKVRSFDTKNSVIIYDIKLKANIVLFYSSTMKQLMYQARC
jgi:hypothetical protein